MIRLKRENVPGAKCSRCRRRERRDGQRYCGRCHQRYMQAYREKKRAELAEYKAFYEEHHG